MVLPSLAVIVTSLSSSIFKNLSILAHSKSPVSGLSEIALSSADGLNHSSSSFSPANLLANSPILNFFISPSTFTIIVSSGCKHIDLASSGSISELIKLEKYGIPYLAVISQTGSSTGLFHSKSEVIL